MVKNFSHLILSACLACLIAGCASINFSPLVEKRLNVEALNQKLETSKIDLSVDATCPGTKTIDVINSETRIEQYCINTTGGCRWYVIPKDFIEYVAKYIKDKLAESNIKTADASNDKILVSLEELKATEGVWTFGSSAKVKIQIPQINYTQTYSGESGSGLGDYAIAYAVHLAVINFLEDPVFQKYVQCR